MRLLRRADIETALPMREAVPLMGQAFRAISEHKAQSAERQVLEIPGGHALLMGACSTGPQASGDAAGVVSKLVTVIPENRRKGLPVSSGLAVLVNHEDGRPLALLDATALTAWRTAAAAGFATDALARRNARCGLLVGCGTQARAQLLAMDAVRELEEIRIMARRPDAVRDLVSSVQAEVSARLRAVDSPGENESSVAQADIITTATTSKDPVFPGHWVSAGCHLNGIGSFREDMRELDQALIAKAAVYVESRRTAAAEAGELIAARNAGMTSEKDWREMGEWKNGRGPCRESETQITLYKSVGHSVFDLFAASAAVRNSESLGLGEEWVL